MEKNTDLDILIERGEDLYKNLRIQDYRFNFMPKYDEKYYIWKNEIIRFLCLNYHNDLSYNLFIIETNKFEKYKSKEGFLSIVAIIKALKTYPKSINNPEEKVKETPIVIHNTQLQNQSQAINIFIDAIKDDVIGKQLRDLKKIIKNEPNSRKAKSSIIDKLKSFGIDVTSNIIANIITNPSILGGMG